ncbi:MAG: EamA family transporter [Bryobacteraceae bacterium]
MKRHPQFWAYAALLAVCFFWGTTYVAIRMSLESFPPLLLVSLRYLISGGVLLAGVLAARAPLPTGPELRRTALNGLLVLGIGNGALGFAELWIPSGLAALVLTLSPFWLLGLNATLPPREPVRPATWLGLLVGLAGAALLVGPGALAGGIHGGMVKGFVVLQLGMLGWNAGSLLQRRMPTRAHPIVCGAVQQLAAGLACAPLALLAGGPIHWSARGAGALLYLVIFGSIVGYSAYVLAMARLPVAVVSLYNYVNPVVAVCLGWAFYREPFGMREALATLLIFLGVAIVKRLEREL